MRPGRRAEFTARALLTLAALLPYWRLLTFGVIFVTDDYFASDIFNGELPGRILTGQMVGSGHWPIWTTQLCSGLPLAGTPADPIGLATFALLPPAPALDLFIIVLLLIAAHGAYALARRFGTDRIGAVLAGVAFAGSGYIACQLKHLAIISTIVWLPLGLLLIDTALRATAGDGRAARRGPHMALFGIVFAVQSLAGFPQSAYICGLVYGAFALFRTIADRRAIGDWRTSLRLLVGIGIAAVLGAAAGAIVLLPLSAVGSLSDRTDQLGYLWSTQLAYNPRNALTFLFPYANGDISNNTYAGPPFFWEDYGYVGLLTFLLAVYGAARERRRGVVLFTIATTLLAYLFVLGRATPVFHVAYLVVPGMKTFRFPTRFLIVVELGLALLGAVGLTRLREDLASRASVPRGAALAVAVGICAATALDLFVHQPRQNPMVSASEWLAPPRTVAIVHQDAAAPRTFTPHHRDLHRANFLRAQGWSNVEPYFELRDFLEPNTGGALWNTASADCYAGVTPRWYVDVWGDHNREASLMGMTTALDFRARLLRMHPAVPNILRTFGVTNILSPFPVQGASLRVVSGGPGALVYGIDGAARVRIVPAARRVTDREAVARLLDTTFDPDREVLIADDGGGEALTGPSPGTPASGGTARISTEDQRHLSIDADAASDGYLVLADTYYPGWTAAVDGKAAPVYRADLSIRAIPIPRGRHQVTISYDPPGFFAGLSITAVALGALVLWAAAAAYTEGRARR